MTGHEETPEFGGNPDIGQSSHQVTTQGIQFQPMIFRNLYSNFALAHLIFPAPEEHQLQIHRLFLLLLKTQKKRYSRLIVTDITTLFPMLKPLVMQAPNSPSIDIPFDIEAYIGEEVSSSLKSTEEPSLSETTKDRLRMLVSCLNVNTADLVRDAGLVRDIFNSIKNDLPLEICETLQSAASIEYHEQKLLGAMKRLDAREARKNLDSQEKQHK